MGQVLHHDPAASADEGVVIVEAFSCDYQGRPVFQDIFLTLPAGRVVGLVGPTGCGKTTFMTSCISLKRSKRAD